MKGVLKIFGVILMVMTLFTITFFLTSAIYQAIGQQPSVFVRYLINILLGCLFGLLAMVAWGRVFEARERAAIRELYRPITEGMEKIAAGDFNISVESNPEVEIVTGELVKSVNRAALELKQMEQMRQEFISNVSHEIQSPLTSIRGFAQALRNEQLSVEDRNHYLAVIETETTRLSRLTENLLKLSSLEAKQPKFEPKPYRLDKQIRSLMLTCEPQWTSKSLDVEVSLTEVVVSADEDLLSQVWLNLIYNSIKFTPPGGRISITLQPKGEMIQFEIKDTGIGMSVEEQARIFERFYKADPSRTRSDDSGSGLGLTIVQKIVELHNGTIAVESVSGVRTTFRVSLPT
ncbi:MAG: HAMP domain-containing histidine kinase [Chloroflexi bacterium]|nr:HAMP domain-containing histidine kinase [Chloroflexota bacterium]